MQKQQGHGCLPMSGNRTIRGRAGMAWARYLTIGLVLHVTSREALGVVAMRNTM